MTADDAIKILRHGVDGMGNEGPEYSEIAGLLETLTKKWRTMTFNEIRAVITALPLVPDMVMVRLPESEGPSSEAITSTETSGLPARQSGPPEVDPSGGRQWIKCSERMPDEMGPQVLVCVIYRDGSHSELFGKFTGREFYDDRDDHAGEMKDDEIWYWQPFPEAPIQIR